MGDIDNLACGKLARGDDDGGWRESLRHDGDAGVGNRSDGEVTAEKNDGERGSSP